MFKMNPSIRHIYSSLLYKDGIVKQKNGIITIKSPYYIYGYIAEDRYIMGKDIRPISYGNPINIRKSK
jgi:hypothetical protein